MQQATIKNVPKTADIESLAPQYTSDERIEMITLRDYQQKAITDVRAALIESPRKHVICEAPTGSGKTILFSYLAQKTVSKGNKVLILSDRTELLTGTGGTLEKFGVK